MGISSDGLLFYGVNIPEDCSVPWEKEDDRDWETWYARVQGLSPPEGDYDKYDSDLRKAFRDYSKERSDIIKSSPLRVDSHCSSDYPIWYIYNADMHYSCSRGYPCFVNETSKIPAAAKENKDLSLFCKTYFDVEIEVYNHKKHKDDIYWKIGWWLASYLG